MTRIVLKIDERTAEILRRVQAADDTPEDVAAAVDLEPDEFRAFLAETGQLDHPAAAELLAAAERRVRRRAMREVFRRLAERKAAKNETAEDTTIYKVVVNDEEQYSIWPAHKKIPLGWSEAGVMGLKDVCLAYIKEVWNIARTRSRRAEAEERANRAASRKQ